jgi:hypothetical protein
MGRLLEDLTRKMQRKADLGDRDPLKILVHSTHDTALAALCATLDVFDEQYASAAVISCMADLTFFSDGQHSPPL